MSTKANPTDKDTLMSNDPLMEEFGRGQRSARIKGVIALLGVAVGIVFLLLGFASMATV